MTPPKDPISRIDKLNAAVLLAVTPEYSKAARDVKVSAERLDADAAPQACHQKLLHGAETRASYLGWTLAQQGI